MPLLTIDLTAAQAARLAHAVGVILGLRDGSNQPRDATPAEVKAYVVGELRSRVRGIEEEEARRAISGEPFEPT